MDNDDLYIIHLNSSNIGLDSTGTPIIATNDSDFSTSIRPLNLNPLNEWVVGVIDVNYYNMINNPTRPLNSELYPIQIFSDIGIQVRNGEATTDLIYLSKPPNHLGGAPPLYFGEKNKGSIAGWRPIQNKSIQKINLRFRGKDGTPTQYNGATTRGFNSITLAVMKIN